MTTRQSRRPGSRLGGRPDYICALASLRRNRQLLTPRSQYRINVVGPIHTINAFLPLLRKGKAKKVITLSSGMGDVDFVLRSGVPNQAPYSISKTALNMAIAKYAVEYKAEGFVFVAVSPGLVNTATKARKWR